MYMVEKPSRLIWVVLTQGTRPKALSAALASIASQADDAGRIAQVIVNGDGAVDAMGQAVETVGKNLGIPGGRNLGAELVNAELIGFLDDDAELSVGVASAVLEAFDGDPSLGAVALRLVDEEGLTARRHTPRLGASGVAESGKVALFLGGASVVRRSAFEEVGGYFSQLTYGHEEVELCWRLVDRGWGIRYIAEAEVFHPKSEIERHPTGWRLSGRNRVWIARRTLPWPVAVPHVLIWLAVGCLRAPGRRCRREYLRGWWSGWNTDWGTEPERQPISLAGVLRLSRLGRPPIV